MANKRGGNVNRNNQSSTPHNFAKRVVVTLTTRELENLTLFLQHEIDNWIRLVKYKRVSLSIGRERGLREMREKKN